MQWVGKLLNICMDCDIYNSKEKRKRKNGIYHAVQKVSNLSMFLREDKSSENTRHVIGPQYKVQTSEQTKAHIRFDKKNGDIITL